MIEVLQRERQAPAQIWPVQDMCLAPAVYERMMGVTRDLYLPLRGVERFILDEPHNVPHRQNDVEHMGHVTYVFDSVYDDRHSLGAHFPPEFDYHETRLFFFYHDGHEHIAGDYNAMSAELTIADAVEERRRREKAAAPEMAKNPATRFAANVIARYQPKDTIEAKFTSDFEKLVDICAIIHDMGRIWKRGNVTLEFMLERRAPAMITPWGKTMMGEFAIQLAKRPELFAPSKTLF